MIPTNLLAFQDHLKLKTAEGKRYIFDQIRCKWLVLLPEEMVRQLMIVYLIENKLYNRNRIGIEHGFVVNQLYRRYDLLVYDEQVQPFLLIECKAPRIKICQDTIDQAAAYNLQFKAPYLCVTNGIETYCWKLDHETKQFQSLNDFPVLPRPQ